MKNAFTLAFAVIVLIFLSLGVYGYFVNLMTLLTDSGGFTPLWVLRIIGLFVLPLGGLMGWVT